MENLGSFIATGIGSTPHTNPLEAAKLIFSDMNEIPFWPQLPKRGYQEGMCGQYIDSLPGIEVNKEKASFSINTNIDHTDSMEKFFQNFIDQNIDYFAIKKESAVGLYAFLDLLDNSDISDVKYLKGHITGPVTFGSLIKDEEGKDIIHNNVFYDCVVKNLAMKAAWQVEILKKYNLPIIIFMDEPSMVSFGSAYSTLTREQVLEVWNEVIDIVHDAGGLVAIHCCGNTDWSILFESKCDIVNFDSIDFFEKMFAYSDKLKEFLGEGRKLAWGAVPTDDRILKETLESIQGKIMASIKVLTDNGFSEKEIIDNSMITPSCGMGTLEIELTESVTAMTKKLSQVLRKEYGIL